MHPFLVGAEKLLSFDEARLRIEVPRYESKEREEKARFVGGPYAPPFVPIGRWLKCELRGELQVAGYTDALIPWPVPVGHHKQLIVCGDLVKALRTESRLAVMFHFGISPQLVSEYRRRLEIERFTAGSRRLFWRNANLARTAEARAKQSRRREGRADTMTPNSANNCGSFKGVPNPKSGSSACPSAGRGDSPCLAARRCGRKKS